MQNVAEARPEVNSTTVPAPQERSDKWRVTSDEKKVTSLTCHKCHAASIPAPEGATHKTGYTCPNCAPLAPELTHFDRCRFEEPFMSRLGMEFNSMEMIAQHERAIASRKSITLLKAAALGERWALNATPDNVLALPRKQRIAMLLVVFCDMRLGEAATLTQDDYHHINRNLIFAKKSLSTNPQHILCDGKPKRKPASRRANSGTDGRRARFQHVERNERRAVRAGAGLAPAEAGNATHFAASA